jgi:hypothetical protein
MDRASFASNTYCVMCTKEVPVARYINHIPCCYREYCIRNGDIPLCTCDSCVGKIAHPKITPTSPAPALSPNDNSTTVSKKRKTEPVGKLSETILLDDPEPSTSQTDASRPDITQLGGKQCVLCRKKKTPANAPFPMIYVGSDRLMICKKAHLNDSKERDRIEKIIQTEMDTVMNKRDADDELLHGSKGKEEEEVEDTHYCDGYEALQPKTHCVKKSPKLLFFEINGKPTVFCKAAHLIRYLCLHYCAQGKKSG